MSEKSETRQFGPWRRMERTEVYDNPWINVSHDRVINPSGSEGIYGVVSFKNIAVGIIALDDEEQTWLVGQYRYTLEAVSWEIPEGGCPVGGDLLAAAQRELEEETGLRAGQWRELMRMTTSNSVTDERAIVYIATDLTAGVQALEDTEADIEIRKLPLREAIAMALDGRITDALSVAALLRLALEKGIGVD